jgi:hypothetical protein
MHYPGGCVCVFVALLTKVSSAAMEHMIALTHSLTLTHSHNAATTVTPPPAPLLAETVSAPTATLLLCAASCQGSAPFTHVAATVCWAAAATQSLLLQQLQSVCVCAPALTAEFVVVSKCSPFV